MTMPSRHCSSPYLIEGREIDQDVRFFALLLPSSPLTVTACTYPCAPVTTPESGEFRGPYRRLAVRDQMQGFLNEGVGLRRGQGAR